MPERGLPERYEREGILLKRHLPGIWEKEKPAEKTPPGYMGERYLGGIPLPYSRYTMVAILPRVHSPA